MAAIPVKSGELGTTRVFSLSMPASEARKLSKDPDAQMALLGAKGLNPAGIEVFAVSDLGDLGLAGYLREGTDAPDADLQRDSSRLAALDGWVMLVHSLSFGGNATTLTPAAPLTLIGTYAQEADDTPPIALEADAAQPYTGKARVMPAKTSDRSRGGSLIVGALILLVLLVLWWALA
ncbi:hypothetical protein Z945_3176 [Sulfitobacter noctilucae]|uniref:hypothetical protein n=1 Tax=Sulfitobacter noctilucae TaxID=1342302 RepID=UPI000469BB8E|nr:hypothetical protein [Sulfitobacter noctilucae]KIN70712.1 hypothetical protein Z945_3176 [Sulfitobacter noctilucae]